MKRYTFPIILAAAGGLGGTYRHLDSRRVADATCLPGPGRLTRRLRLRGRAAGRTPDGAAARDPDRTPPQLRPGRIRVRRRRGARAPHRVRPAGAPGSVRPAGTVAGQRLPAGRLPGRDYGHRADRARPAY